MALGDRITVVVDFVTDGAQKALGKFRREVDDTDDKVSKSAKKHKASMATIRDATIAGFGVSEIIQYAGEVFATGTALEAMKAKSKTVFGETIGIVQEWAKKNAASMGLTQDSAIGAGAAIQDLLVPMGFTRDEATKQTTALLELSGALSAWSGGQRSAEEVSQILTKAMLGEREELKSLGISISAADVQARIAEKGQQKLAGAARAQAEAVATQELIYEKSTDAQKAWADGSMDATKKANESKAAMAQVSQTIATALLPALSDIVEVVGPAAEGVGWLAEKVTDLSDAAGGDSGGNPFGNLKENTEWFLTNIKEGKSPVQAFTKEVEGTVGSISTLSDRLEDTVGNATAFGDEAKEAAEKSFYLGEQQDFAAGAAERLKKKLEDEKKAIDGVLDSLDSRKSFLGVQEDVSTLKTRLEELRASYESGKITAEEYWFDTQNMVLDTESNVADYLAKLGNVPAEVISKVTTLIENGDLERATALIDHWASMNGKTISIKTLASWVNGTVTPIVAGSKYATGTSWAPGGPTLVGEHGPEVVDMPRGARVTPNGARYRGSGTSIGTLIVQTNDQPRRWFDEALWRVAG